MSPFPAVEPIAVPAPIWLIKLLHIVTMALHFVAVQMLVGGLFVALLVHLLRGCISVREPCVSHQVVGRFLSKVTPIQRPTNMRAASHPDCGGCGRSELMIFATVSGRGSAYACVTLI